MRKKGTPVFILSLLLIMLLSSRFSPAREEKLLICGSTCMERLCRTLAQAYMAENPGVRIEVELGGSTMGLAGAAQGRVDLASSSRDLTEAEQALIHAVPIAYDRIAVVVNPGNPIRSLSIEQLAAVYSGEIRDWSPLGWEGGPIVAVGRETGSGTRTTFEQRLLGEKRPLYAQELLENGMVRTAVSITPGAIGYLSSAYLDESVRQVSVGGREGGGSTFRRAYFLGISRDGEHEAAEQFLAFALGADGQRIVRSMGYDGAGERAA